jgi:uncharacterized protein
MEADRIKIKPLLIGLGALFIIELLARLISVKSSMHPMLVTGWIRLADILLILLIITRWGNGLSSIGLGRPQILPGLKTGLIGSALFGVATLMVSAILVMSDIEPQGLIKTPMPFRPLEIFLIFAVGGIVAPVAEEIFFRGLIYGYLRRWGLPVALIVSTLIFVLAHPMGAKVPVTQIMGGVVFALAYEVKGYLLAPISIHILGNMSIYLLNIIL